MECTYSLSFFSANHELSVSLTSCQAFPKKVDYSIGSFVLFFDFMKLLESTDLFTLLMLTRDLLVFLAVKSAGRESSSCGQ